jgi:hypothetical protein
MILTRGLFPPGEAALLPARILFFILKKSSGQNKRQSWEAQVVAGMK